MSYIDESNIQDLVDQVTQFHDDLEEKTQQLERDKITIGVIVQIVQKQDQRTRKLTKGAVKRILTSSNFHPHGIKVELDNGKVGRVQNIF